MMNPQSTYLRVRIRGQMKVCTELHIGDGEQLAMNQRPNPNGQLSSDGHYQSTCTGNEQRLYIPGSSLRGALRHWIGENANKDANTASMYTTLFGPKTTAGNTSAKAGQLRVANLVWAVDDGNDIQPDNLPFWDSSRTTTIRQHTAINAITRTAEEHHLFQYEMVPVGTLFNVILEIHGTPESWVTEASVKHLLAILAAWDGSHPNAQLGHGSSLSLGKVEWVLDKQKVEVITQNNMQAWLNGNDSTTSFNMLPWETITFEPLSATDPFSTQKVVITLFPRSPYLSNEAGLVAAPRKAENNELTDSSARLRFARDINGKPMLPATSLKGWLRAYAHKIVATIAHQEFNSTAQDSHTVVQGIIDQLFGNKLQSSLIDISAGQANSTLTHTQTFSAIDRFTGGVSHSKGEPSLYTVEAALSPLTATLYLAPQLYDKDQQHWHGLLLLILRDVLADNLWLGWGQAKGYGQFEVTIQWADNNETKKICDFSALINDETAKTNGHIWIGALHDYINTHLADKTNNNK